MNVTIFYTSIQYKLVIYRFLREVVNLRPELMFQYTLKPTCLRRNSSGDHSRLAYFGSVPTPRLRSQALEHRPR
ncbi:Protein of unknown function [Gryllus bimaculatus]|nr:Protein of unknown function [Gryllus bimaculatus]